VRRTITLRRVGARLAALLGSAEVIVGVALLAVVSVNAISRPSHDTSPAAAAPAPAPSVEAASAVAPRITHKPPAKRRRRHGPPARPARPVLLSIPAIGVRAPVIRLGLDRDRSLKVPKDFGETGWWAGGPRPGERGPAVIAGHVDSYTGPAVFFGLRDLHPGDSIIVLRRDGTRARFAVQRSQEYPKDRFPTARVYGRTARPTLRLITCGGEFDRSSGHYLDNTVVYASLADR